MQSQGFYINLNVIYQDNTSTIKLAKMENIAQEKEHDILTSNIYY